MAAKPEDGTWCTEILHADYRQGLRVARVLYDSATEHQRLVVFESPTFGRVLTLDDVVQTTEADEFIYHEMLAHVPLIAHGHARLVAIVGGGDGGLAEEVLKHPSVERVTMIEIDAGVVDFAREHLPSIGSRAFDDPRLDLVIADGRQFMAETEARFDVILIDSTDPIGPGEVLFTRAFYADCKRCLNPDGILVTQNGVPFLQAGELRASLKAFASLFADATCYLCTVPTYAGGPMALGWASDQPAHRQHAVATLRARYAEAGLDGVRYVNAEVHQAAFALPNYVRELVPA